MSVILETTLGDIVIDLFVKERPKCCFNFLKLCKLKYYNYTVFSKVQSGFIAQTGENYVIKSFYSKLGKVYERLEAACGESVYKFISRNDDEKFFDMEKVPRINHTCKGLVSFVNNGYNKHGSQFFITLGDNLTYLDGKHTVFGVITESFDVLDKINIAICDENDIPYQDIRISHTIILDDPFDDPPELNIPAKYDKKRALTDMKEYLKSFYIRSRSPSPIKEHLSGVKIAAHEDIDEFIGMDENRINQIIEDRELKANENFLEIIGDIPDADLKPPENVLFVCKLNALTQADELKVIFSRFGKILSCEIIKDRRTQRSLRYGFIEFENVKDCENAYLKMENVLIDDRRIHVNFCQSIKPSQWKRAKISRRYRDITDKEENEIDDYSDDDEDDRKTSRNNVSRKRTQVD